MLQQISRYRIERLLGAGGMGEVYLAEDETLRRKVALKLLPERFSDDVDRVRRFQREARAASALNHPNIITIYEIGESDARHYIATEYIEGITLRERIISSRQVTVGEVLDVANGVANALAAAHEAGIIHRDIKPENVMLRPDGYVKVLDFGLAKINDNNSTTGALMGTLFYLSPEQARGLQPDARSDIYSLGVVLYELLTRRPPHSGDNFVQLALSIANDEVEPPSRYAESVPPELDRIILKALEKDPGKRYASARALLDDLRVLRRELEYDNQLIRTSDPVLAHQRTELLTVPPVMTSNVIVLWKTRRWIRYSAITAIVLAVIATALLFVNDPFGSGAIDSVAVLPFVNDTGSADNEYLSDGIAESIIDSLSQLPKTRVLPRTTSFRYKGRNVDPLAAGKELQVRGVVSGQVRQHGGVIVVRTSLSDVRTGAQVWGERYERSASDVLSLQQEMSRQISDQLRVQLTGAEKALLTKRTAASPEAFELYLKGRYQLNKYTEESARKAIELFNRAIDADPSYALAYAGLADAYYRLSNIYMAPREAMPRSRKAAMRALEIDDSLGPAHAALATVLAWFEWDFDRAAAEFRRALALNQSDSETHRAYSTFLTAIGRFDEAVTVGQKALQLDPLSAPASYSLARTLFFAGRTAEAKKTLRATLELNDHFAHAYFLGAQIAFSEGNTAETFRLIDRAIATGGRSPLYVTLRGYVSARTGDRAGAVTAMNELKARPNYTLPLFLARIHTGLGEHDEALRWLEQCVSDRSESVLWLKVDPSFAPLRNDPRFVDLMKRIGASHQS